MLYVNTRTIDFIANHANDYEATGGPVVLRVDKLFNSVWKDDWINSDFGRRIITDIDKKDILHSVDPRGDLAYKYRIAPQQLCTGTKNCLLARYYVTNQRIYMTFMGPNCYKYLFEASDYRDIKVTVDYFVPVRPEDMAGHKAYFEDLDREAKTSMEFSSCLSKCLEKGLFGELDYHE